MRKIIALLLCLVLISCAKQQEVGSALGETIMVNYIGKFENGTVFDTNLESVANANGLDKGNFEPLQVTLGKGMVIPGFEMALIGMNVGDRNTVTLTPAQAYGDIDRSKILKMDTERSSDRNMRLSRIFDIPIEQIPQDAEEEFAIGNVNYKILERGDKTAKIEVLVNEGDQIMIPKTFWNSTVIEVADEYYVVRQDPAHGSVMNSAFGPVRLLVNDEKIVMRLEVEEGGYLRTGSGVGKVIVANDIAVVMDFNHPLAGKSLIFEIEVVG